jgi:hypothetical protein
MVMLRRSKRTVAHRRPKQLADAPKNVTYRGYQLNLHRDGDAWWVFFCRTDRTVPEEIVPRTRLFADQGAAIEEAKLVIDSFFRSLTFDDNWPG